MWKIEIAGSVRLRIGRVPGKQRTSSDEQPGSSDIFESQGAMVERSDEPGVRLPLRVGFQPEPEGCRKVGYVTEAAAAAALTWLATHSHAEKVPRRSYECPQCRGWHLTSQPPRAPR